MRVYLIHPGENSSGLLTQNGVWQIRAVARRFITENKIADRIYVNGHAVSRQSGEILSKSLVVPMISDERFSEVNNKVILGMIEERDLENLDYINVFIDEVVQKGKDAIITIGGGIHRMIISRLTGMSLKETRHFSFLEGGISVLEYQEKDSTGKWRIVGLNDETHLRVP